MRVHQCCIGYFDFSLCVNLFKIPDISSFFQLKVGPSLSHPGEISFCVKNHLYIRVIVFVSFVQFHSRLFRLCSYRNIFIFLQYFISHSLCQLLSLSSEVVK